MDCGLALRPLSCDVNGREPPGTGARRGRLGLRKAERASRASPLLSASLALAFTASTASAGTLQDRLPRPELRALRPDGGVRDSAGRDATASSIAGSEDRRASTSTGARVAGSATRPTARRTRRPELRLERAAACRTTSTRPQSRPRRHAHHPLGAGLGAARRPRRPGDAQPRSPQKLKQFTRAATHAIPRRASSGVSGTSRTTRRF